MFISSSTVVFPNHILRHVWTCPRVSDYAKGILAADDGFVVYLSFHRYVCCRLSRSSTLTFVSFLLLGVQDLLQIVQENKLLNTSVKCGRQLSDLKPV